jgi:hypothetical protein
MAASVLPLAVGPQMIRTPGFLWGMVSPHGLGTRSGVIKADFEEKKQREMPVKSGKPRRTNVLTTLVLVDMDWRANRIHKCLYGFWRSFPMGKAESVGQYGDL